MARVSIYVSDELKARMAEVGDALNWSDIARPAFETAISEFNHRRNRSVETAIERLKASKAKYLQYASDFGAKSGRQWAEDKASFYQLKQISKIDLDIYEDFPEQISVAIHNSIDPDQASKFHDMPEILFGDRYWPPEEWLIGWVRGAQEFFEEIKDQL